MDTIRNAIEYFCNEFLKFPYLCYTEHGLHARFYCLLHNALPKNQRYVMWEGKEVCAIQKEYPTADALGKPKRQHWDIAVIQAPPSSLPGKSPSFDYLALNSVVEFGLNASREHLVDDIKRLSHPRSNVKNKFIIHLYRLSNHESRRDLSTKSRQKLLECEDIKKLVQNTDVEVYFCRFDNTKRRFLPGGWRIDKNKTSELLKVRISSIEEIMASDFKVKI